MSEHRFTNQSHENNGPGNGVLHEALPGTGTLPEGLLREAAAQSVGAARSQAEPGNEEATSDFGSERNKFRSTTEQGRAADDPASRAASAAGPDRGPDGRFLLGNRGGPGNPHARRVGLLQQAALEVCPPERYANLVDIFLRLAEAGDRDAAKFIFPYIVGRPQQSTHPDRLDFEEWQMHRESADWMAEVPSLLTRPSRWLPLGTVREVQPVLTKEKAGQMSYVVNAQGKEREKVDLWLSDPQKGLEKLDKARHRQQTGQSAKKKKRRR